MKNKTKKHNLKESSPGNPHDTFVKRILGQKRHGMDFFKSQLPEKVLALLDLNTLKAEKDSFISTKLRSAFSDMIFSVQFKEQAGKAFLYTLLEHKSHPDIWCKLQILKYMSHIWEKHHRDTPSQLLPPIIPIVLYHGKEEWEKKEIIDLLDGGQPALFRPYTPKFETLFCDAQHFSETAQHNILLHIFLSTLSAVMGPEAREKSIELIEILLESDEPEDIMREFLETLLIYLNTVRPDMDDVLEMAIKTPHHKEKLMLIFEKYLAKGTLLNDSDIFQLGEKQGVQKGLQKSLKKLQKLQEGLQKARQEARQKLQEARQEARQEAQRKDYETLLRLHALKLPLETIALAVALPADSVQMILKDGFKAMEQMYLEENTVEKDKRQKKR